MSWLKEVVAPVNSQTGEIYALMRAITGTEVKYLRQSVQSDKA